MPTSFLSADAGFPRLTPDIPAEERLNRIQNYLYMLLEQLRYTLYNLGEENFNEESLKEIGQEIQEPVMAVVTDLEGNMSSISQTATAITTRLDNFNGSSSTIEQTATSLTTRLNDFDGSGSTIEQTAERLQFAVFDPAGDVSLVSQKADRIDWIVASGTSAASMTLTSDMLQLIADEVAVYGAVTFTDLSTQGQSVINGDNIELKADADGDSVSYLTYTSVNGNTFAQIHTRDNQAASTLTSDRYAFVIETPRVVDGDFCAMKLVSGDSMSLESGWLLYMQAASQVVINNGLLATRIQANNVSYVSGDSSYPADCYIFASDGIYYGGTRILAT